MVNQVRSAVNAPALGATDTKARQIRRGECGTLPIFLSAVKARRDRMVEFARRTMSDERGTMSAGCKRAAGQVETMRMTADSLRPARVGQETHTRLELLDTP